MATLFGMTLASFMSTTSSAFSINPLITSHVACSTLKRPLFAGNAAVNKQSIIHLKTIHSKLYLDEKHQEHERNEKIEIYPRIIDLNDPSLHTKNNAHSRIQDESRRSLLKLIISSSASVMGIISSSSNTPYAYAEDTDLLEIDQQKVVMQVSAKNIPQRYGPSSSTTSDNLDKVDSWMTEVEMRRIDVFEKAAPSVVFIDTYVETRDAFSTNVMEVPIGTGSGFVWDDRGHIVTNYHVVRSAKSAQIAILSRKFDDDDDGIIDTDDDGDDEKNRTKRIPSSKQQRIASSSLSTPLSQKPIRSTTMRNDAGVTNYARKVYKARVVGVDPGKDIAVLKIDAPVFDLYPIDVGTSTGLKVGQSAYAIGNPFGLDHTLTVGVVSGIGREVKSPIGRPITK